VEAIVRRVLAATSPAFADSAPEDAEPKANEEVDALIARLKNPNLSSFERSQIIDALARAGRVDDVIAMMAEAAKADPSNPDRKVDVALSLLSKLRNGKVSQMEQATLGMAADKALDEALALDDQHWDARFNKAISLSFWPPVMGKQPEAIQHFETLIDQQGRGAPQPHHAQTHLWLGNLYQQSGKSELARKTWAAGLELFPGSESLQERLGQ
jgi:tetratricopeptide (TPR) repeat protein